MDFEYAENNIILTNTTDFDLEQTLDCGQCFRWNKIDDFTFEGIVEKQVQKISQRDGKTIFYNCTPEMFQSFWCDYFDLNRDYGKVKAILSADERLAKAAEFAPGIRILRQRPWETLCSFIISQNNNIKRIKGIVARLCEQYGERLDDGHYAFPSAQRLAVLAPDDLAPLRCGFRARYIIDAAQKVAGGEIVLSELYSIPIDDAVKQLCKITGVGIKVAQCTLLYGFSRMECFPVDVWIRRVMEMLFPDGLPAFASEYAGIAQQYLFHYARVCPDAFAAANETKTC